MKKEEMLKEIEALKDRIHKLEMEVQEPERLLKFKDIIEVVKNEYPDIKVTAINRGAKSQMLYAEKVIAIAKLMILADYYNDGWVADWSDSGQMKWLVKQTRNSLIVDDYEFMNFGFPTFKSKELAQTALDNNREIFEAVLK